MDEEELIGRKINIFSKEIHRKIGKMVAKYGLTNIQSRIIGFVYFKSKNQDVFQKDIEKEFNIRRSSVTSVLNLMQKNGYITRDSVAYDARLKKIILTDKGLQIQEKVYSCILKCEEALRNEINDSEFSVLMNLLDRLTKIVAE